MSSRQETQHVAASKGTISDEQIRVNNFRIGKLGKPEKATDKKKSEDEIDFSLEEISLAMYRKQKEGGKKKKTAS